MDGGEGGLIAVVSELKNLLKSQDSEVAKLAVLYNEAMVQSTNNNKVEAAAVSDLIAQLAASLTSATEGIAKLPQNIE